MLIKFTKLNPAAKIPKKAHLHDAAFDLVASDFEHKDRLYIYDTGIAVNIPPGFCGLVFPRSSVVKFNLRMANSVGVIDSGYTGPIKCAFQIATSESDFKVYSVGDRIAQLMILPLPAITFVEVDDVDDFDYQSERGAGGYGSTGV